MSFVDAAALDQMSAVLLERREMAYGVLFLGSLFETLIPLSLIVLGEVFFLAGALLAGMGTLNVWAVLGALYAGGIVGDNLSYWLGRRFGASLFECLSSWPFVGRLVQRDIHRRGMSFFARRGAAAVFAARLSGPLSWVMPAMAGMFRLDYVTFLRFNTLGIIVGIGQFIVVGYCFGEYLPWILALADPFSTALFATAPVLIPLAVWYWWKRREQALS